MARNTKIGSGQGSNFWRIALWSSAALLLLLPLVAMQFTEEVNWDLVDFAVFGSMLVGACGAYELAKRVTGDTAYRAAVAVAVAAAFILVWLSLGVGIIGKDGDPANRMYFGVLAVGILGALIARFRPAGMARAMFAMALAQALIALIAIVARLGSPWSGPLELSLLNGFFVALFVGSAWLFLRSAQGRSARSRPNRDAI